MSRQSAPALHRQTGYLIFDDQWDRSGQLSVRPTSLLQPTHRVDMNAESLAEPFRDAAWIERTQRLLDSYRRWVGRELIDRGGDPANESQRLFEAPFVVVAHGTQPDPIFNYANRCATGLW